MGAEPRTAIRERRPPAVVVARSPAVAAPAPVGRTKPIGRAGPQALLRSVQAQPKPAAPVQAKLAVSSPSDPAEVEAHAMGRAVAAMPEASGAAAIASPSGPQVQRRAAGAPKVSGNLAGRIRDARSSGRPLPDGVRRFMEPRFGADFRAVRIHTDTAAAALNAELRADAFTLGPDIFFAAGRFRPDTAEGRELIAHELTHVLQQGAGARAQVQRAPKSLADQLSEGFDDAIDSASKTAGELLDLGEDLLWAGLNSVAPELAPIFRKGPSGALDWLKGRAETAVEAAFETFTAPVRSIGGAGDRLTARFTPFVTSLQVAAGQIARNDCTPLREAAEKIEQTVEAIVTPIVETIQPIVAKVSSFLNDAWDLIGAPIWNWIKRYAQQQWELVLWLWGKVKAFGDWIWDKTKGFRELAAKAWQWVKDKLGFGEGPGLLDWLKEKLEAAWAPIRARLEPYKAQILTVLKWVGGILVMLSPAGPVIAIAAAVVGAIKGLRWIRAHWGKADMVVVMRGYLEKELIPGLIGAAERMVATIGKAAAALSNALGSVAAALGRAAAAVGSSLLRVAASAVQWLADQALSLAKWAEAKVGQVAFWVRSAVTALASFLRKILDFLAGVGRVIKDIWSLPALLMGKVWNAIPACIRDPVVDFFGKLILGNIELFQELVRDEEAWAKTKTDVGKLIRKVFVDFDLFGAVRDTFYLVLRVFNMPPKLLATLASKAETAWDVVIKAPLAFIKNAIRSIGRGFALLWENFWTHLQFGLQGWLLGALGEAKISLPASWTDPKAVFNFVLDVLGLTMENVFTQLEKRYPGKIQKLRAFYGKAMAVVDWIKNSIDTSKSPAENAAGLVKQAKGFGAGILEDIATWVMGQVGKELAIMAAAAAASAGLSEVLDIARRIYRALVSAVRLMPKILGMIEKALDNVLLIAGGQVDAAGKLFEDILHQGMPVVIGFLADQVGLGGIGAEIRAIVAKLRAAVDEALLWLIDKAKAVFDAIVGAVQAGVEAITDWWKRKVMMQVGGRSHVLQIDGGRENPQLMVHSKPNTVKEFVKPFLSIKGTEAQVQKAGVLADQVGGLLANIRAAEARKDKPEAAKLALDLAGPMDELGKLLQGLMVQNAEEGSEEHPVQVDYPKRAAAGYPDIYVGPRIGEGLRIEQRWLRELYGASNAKAKAKLLEHEPRLATRMEQLDKWTKPVLKFSATSQVDLEPSKRVGLSPQFASLGAGRILCYDEKHGTGGGHKINDLFKPYGFVPSSKNGEGMDGDHVVERQLGGPDELENLWPLDRGENRSSGAIIKSIKCQFGGEEKTVHKALEERKKSLYLLIRSVKVA